MAREYDLYLAASMKPRQALELLAEQIGGLIWSEDDFCLVHEVVTITAAETRIPGRGPTVVEEVFGFALKVRVGFRFVNNTDYDVFRQIMLRATMLLLEHAQDAVLLFNGEIIVLQRLGGNLVFNVDHHIWDDDDLLKSGVSFPFERRPLPSPLL
jgi:hypothetical protein